MLSWKAPAWIKTREFRELHFHRPKLRSAISELLIKHFVYLQTLYYLEAHISSILLDFQSWQRAEVFMGSGDRDSSRRLFELFCHKRGIEVFVFWISFSDRIYWKWSWTSRSFLGVCCNHKDNRMFRTRKDSPSNAVGNVWPEKRFQECHNLE